MACQSGMDTHMRGLGVAHFADHDHIRVLAQKRAQGGCESEADGRMNLGLIDARDLIFDRIFDR